MSYRINRITRRLKQISLASLATFLLGGAVMGGSAFAQQKKKPSPPKPLPKPLAAPPAVKGQGQLVGGIGKFGETYSLTHDFNFTLLGAHYTVEPLGDYSSLYPNSDQKLLVLDLSLKNTAAGDNWFNSDGFITAVDSKGNLFTENGGITLKSAGRNTNLTLRPGQGFGQPALNDPVRIAILVPSDARIVKIMINQPRLNVKEEVFRYYIAGATREEAGEAGDPKNAITPLPVALRNTSDPSGAVALASGTGTVGATTNDCTSNLLTFRVNSITTSTTELIHNNPPEEGKIWVIANVTAAFPLWSGKAGNFKEVSNFDFPGMGGGFAELVDSEGEKYELAENGSRKPSKDEEITRSLNVGEDYTYRLFFSIPKDATPKKLTIGATNGRKWSFDIK